MSTESEVQESTDIACNAGSCEEEPPPGVAFSTSVPFQCTSPSLGFPIRAACASLVVATVG